METMCSPDYHRNLAEDVRLQIAGTNEPKSAQQAKQDGRNIYVIMKTICPLVYR